MNAAYALRSRWTVACSREELWDVLELLLATDDPMVWWPSVQVADYDGDAMHVRARSGLGYTLTFTLADLDVRRPDSLTFSSAGDLRGAGSATVARLGPSTCRMDIVWNVAAGRRWMRLTGWLLRPVFVAGHHLVMRRGQRHLNAWIAARR